jgi:plastocyanin
MKRFFYIALSAILFWTCGEEFQPANPLDPETPDYESPEVIFVDSISEGDTLETETVTFGWTGNELVTAYRYKLDDNDWSAWTADTTATLDYLDEGDHNVSIQSSYSSGDTSSVASVSFVVDAVTGPALMFYPRRHIASVGETVTFQILAEEVEDLTAAEFTISFDPADLEIISITQGSMFTESGESIFHAENGPGTLTILTAILGGENPSVSGTGDLVTVEVSVVQTGETELTFDGSEVFRDPDNNNVSINETVAGLVVVE